MKIFYILIFFLFFFSFSSEGRPSNVRAPSIFPPQEKDLHKYSAILAATEPFRILCQEQVKQALGPLQSFSFLFSGSKILDHAEKYRQKNSAVDVAINRFEKRVDHALQSYGMSANDFNKISESLTVQPPLKRKVLLQSYFYKIAADLDANINRNLPKFPIIYKGNDRLDFSNFLKPSPTSSPLLSPSSSPSTKRSAMDIYKFSNALYEIESERIKMRDKLKRDLHLQDLPPNMSEPSYLPAMCSQIQRACRGFPSAVSEILRKESLSPEVFDEYYTKMNNNRLFKWKIEKNLRKITKEKKKTIELERKLRIQHEKLKSSLHNNNN